MTKLIGRLGRRQWFLHIPKVCYIIVSDFGMEFLTHTFWQGIHAFWGWDVHAGEGIIPWKYEFRWEFQERITYERWLDTGRVLI